MSAHSLLHRSAFSMRIAGWHYMLLLLLAIGCVLPSLPATAQRVESIAPDKPQPRLPTMPLKIGRQSIKAEIAADDASRQRGMMFRTKMGANEGMLFVFAQDAYYAMWMRNTLLPLSLAFIDGTGRIVSLHEMAPRTETSHRAEAPARYALEMNAGWFARHGIKVGDVVHGLDKAPPAK